jgi:transposase InsO family protein
MNGNSKAKPPEGHSHNGARSGCWPAPDLVDRKFATDAPNKLWVADIN